MRIYISAQKLIRLSYSVKKEKRVQQNVQNLDSDLDL